MSPAPMASETSTLPTLEDALALGLTREEYELVCEKQGRPPNSSSWRCTRCCGASTAPTSTREAPAHASHRGAARGDGPGRERRRGGRGGRAGVRVQGRVAQPPERGRAVPGRGDRRRGDPARHLRDRRAADRGARLAALRRADHSSGAAGARSRYLLDGAVAGIGHYGNSIGVPTVGGEVYFERPYEQNCLVNAMALGLAPREQLDAQRRRRSREPARAVRRVHRPRRHRRRVGARLGRARREPTATEGAAADMRPTVQVGDPVRRRRSCSSARSSCSSGGCSSRCRTSAPPG